MDYTIVAGDTLSGIAAANGTTVDELMALNPQITNPNLIRAGATLTLPDSGTAPGTAPATGGSNDLIGVPPNMDVWKVGEDWYLVRLVPGTYPPIPLIWKVEDEATRQALGIKTADRTLSAAELTATGALPMGFSKEIPPSEVDPWEAVVSDYETEVQVKPWLADPEVLAKLVGATIEGRAMTAAELQTTEWWRSRNAAERAWASTYASDPMTAEQMIADNRLAVQSAMEAAGIYAPPQSVVNMIADKQTMGQWSEAYAMQQINLLSDPYASGTIDPELAASRGQLDTTRSGEDAVRSLVNKWLGPAYAAGWSDQNIAEWAGRFRNDPDAQTILTEALRAQRLALFPDYNESLTYEDIAGPWRSVWQQMWGQIPDETDPLFTQLISANDLTYAKQTLRTEGLKRGVGSVAYDALGALQSALGGQVRPSMA